MPLSPFKSCSLQRIKKLDEAEEQKRQGRLAQFFFKETSKQVESVVREAIAESAGSASTVGGINWAQLIRNSSEIDFIVQGWDGWSDAQEVAPALEDFFERSGVMRLYLYDKKADEGQQVRRDMANRLGKAPQHVFVEIDDTYNNLKQILDRSKNSSGRIELYSTTRIIWYFAAHFKGRITNGQERMRDVSVFSFYSHTARRPWNMPAITVYPDTQLNDFEIWFGNELTYLRNESELENETVAESEKNNA